jgi:microcystin-dependent protein
VSSPYIGEIRMFGGNFAPAGWAFCDGQIMPIAENDALFNLIGTTYGGDGQSTFGLPDLRGRLPVHNGNGLPLAQSAGTEYVTLTTNQMPAHSHPFIAVGGTAGTDIAPTNNLPAESYNVTPYINDATTAAFDAAAVGGSGGSQPHDNHQPYLAINFIISLFGIYPAPT